MIQAVNETCFLITLSDKIDLSLTPKISNIVASIETELAEALIDITPSYNTVLVEFDLLKVSPLVVEHQLQNIVQGLNQNTVHNIDKTESLSGKLIELPVYYDASVGWDLKKVARENNLSIEQVIHLHSDKTYQVCAIGFTPGFAFLAELDDKINQPRHSTPRVFVPAGSVAIADKQTAVYPSNSPGGWHVIGNCPLPLFDINHQPISPFTIGDRVKFTAIDYLQFIELGGEVINE